MEGRRGEGPGDGDGEGRTAAAAAAEAAIALAGGLIGWCVGGDWLAGWLAGAGR